MYYTGGKQLPSNKWCACSTLNVMYVCTYLAGDVGGDRVGETEFAERLKGEMFLVLEAFDTTVCVHLDLLLTDVCSQERAAPCVSSCAGLQWVT